MPPETHPAPAVPRGLPNPLLDEHGSLSRNRIVRALLGEFDDELRSAADALRRAVHGDELHVRAIIEISNVCRRDCLYCGLRASNPHLRRYRMEPEEVIDAALRIREAGFWTIVLQSGEDPFYSGARVTDLVGRIKEETGCAITLSLGEWPEEDYAAWRAAGADRYLLKHETANPVLYDRLHPDSTLDERLAHLRALKRLGYQTGSGAMTGLPGQTAEDLADDILLCARMGIGMAGFGPFISHPDTPLRDAPGGGPRLALRVVAAARLVMPLVHLPATTSLSVLDPVEREAAYRWGANVVMPDVTPEPYRHYYEIYPGKGGGVNHAETAMKWARDFARRLGLRVADHPGHALLPA